MESNLIIAGTEVVFVHLNNLHPPKTHILMNLLEGGAFPYVKTIEGSKGYKKHSFTWD